MFTPDIFERRASDTSRTFASTRFYIRKIHVDGEREYYILVNYIFINYIFPFFQLDAFRRKRLGGVIAAIICIFIISARRGGS